MDIGCLRQRVGIDSVHVPTAKQDGFVVIHIGDSLILGEREALRRFLRSQVKGVASVAFDPVTQCLKVAVSPRPDRELTAEMLQKVGRNCVTAIMEWAKTRESRPATPALPNDRILEAMACSGVPRAEERFLDRAFEEGIILPTF